MRPRNRKGLVLVGALLNLFILRYVFNAKQIVSVKLIPIRNRHQQMPTVRILKLQIATPTQKHFLIKPKNNAFGTPS